MVSSKAKTVSIVFRAELTAVDEPGGMSFAKREPRPSAQGLKGGVSGTLTA
jgi:hypothetical protein